VAWSVTIYIGNVTLWREDRPVSLHFTLNMHVNDNISSSIAPRKQSLIFDDEFSRCYPLLTFLASRILACSEEVAEAVQNCRITASRNPPGFECEGAFRSWLARVLIEEALAILRQRKAVSPLVAMRLDEYR
jgi:DNA-directed RNA polymerase specialized sigma24 family protein